jgi:hypothetical protein
VQHVLTGRGLEQLDRADALLTHPHVGRNLRQTPISRGPLRPVNTTGNLRIGLFSIFVAMKPAIYSFV